MRKNPLILTLLLFIAGNLTSFGQEENISPSVYFDFDSFGNRTKRYVEIIKISKNEQSDSLDTTQLSSSLNSIKKISLYPNPNQGQIDLKIIGMLDGKIAEYIFSSLSGQELLRKTTGIPLTKIDISSFAPGTYLVMVTLDEVKEVWKIIKH